MSLAYCCHGLHCCKATVSMTSLLPCKGRDLDRKWRHDLKRVVLHSAWRHDLDLAVRKHERGRTKLHNLWSGSWRHASITLWVRVRVRCEPHDQWPKSRANPQNCNRSKGNSDLSQFWLVWRHVSLLQFWLLVKSRNLADMKEAAQNCITELCRLTTLISITWNVLVTSWPTFCADLRPLWSDDRGSFD